MARAVESGKRTRPIQGGAIPADNPGLSIVAVIPAAVAHGHWRSALKSGAVFEHR
jgi:hypothetical protein